MILPRRVILGGILALAACDEATTPSSPARFEISLTQVPTDTIRHLVPDTFVVRLRRGNAPVEGAKVRVLGGRGQIDRIPQPPFVSLRLIPVPLLDDQYHTEIIKATDQAGEIRFTAQLGTTAGRDYLLISAPLLDLVDSVGFEVKPGSPMRTEVSPQDTAVLAGASYHLSVNAVDAALNPIPTSFTVATDSTAVSIGTDGTITAARIGRAFLRVVVGTEVFPAAVSVVPSAVIAGHFGHRIVVARTDGAPVGWIPALLPEEGGGVGWTPGGASVSFHMGGAIHLADSLGRFPRLFEQQFPFVEGEAWARYLPDGNAVLLNSGTSLWRVKLPSLAADLLSGFPTFPVVVNLRASPSPDGRRAAFTRDDVLSLMDLRTKAVTSLGVFGFGARWSPDGAWIAYGDGSGGLWIIRPDGSGARSLTTGRPSVGQLDWSPDGKWLVSLGSAGFELVQVSPLVVLPLPHTRGGTYPAWRP